MPGPGEKDSAQSEGNFNLEPIVRFLMFSLSFLRSYSPGPGLRVWLNIETDLQNFIKIFYQGKNIILEWNHLDIIVYK